MIYAAKSTKDKHGSIPTQLEDRPQMAEREGWTVVGEFQDEASAPITATVTRGSPGKGTGDRKQRPSMGDAWSSLRMQTGSLEVPAADTSPAPCGTAPGANDRFHAQHVTGPHDRIGESARRGMTTAIVNGNGIEARRPGVCWERPWWSRAA